MQKEGKSLLVEVEGTVTVMNLNTLPNLVNSH